LSSVPVNGGCRPRPGGSVSAAVGDSSLHPGFLTGLGDDGLAVVEVPRAHSTGHVEGVEAVLVEPGDSPVRASAGAADDVHVVIERQIVETGGQLTQRHVVSAFDVSCLPLVV